jgi:predicted nucleotidyltransferase component of viral defense system
MHDDIMCVSSRACSAPPFALAGAHEAGQKMAKKLLLKGNACLNALDFGEAFELLSAALDKHPLPDGRIRSQILANRSLARLRLLETSSRPDDGTAALALRDAEEAVIADASYNVATLRKAKALESLGGREADAAKLLALYQKVAARDKEQAAAAEAIAKEREKQEDLRLLEETKRQREKAANDERKLKEQQREATVKQRRKVREHYFKMCKRGRVPAIEEALLEVKKVSGEGKSFCAPDGRNGLHVAVAARKLKAIEFLLRDSQFGCVNPSTADDYGVTPLHLAAEHGGLPIVQTLLEHGADMSKVCESKLGTPLHTACANGKLEIANVLLAAVLQRAGAADMDMLQVWTEKAWVNANGDTPLHLACKHGSARSPAFKSIAGIFLDDERLAPLARVKNAAGECPKLAALGIMGPPSSVAEASECPAPAVATVALPTAAVAATPTKKPASATWKSLTSAELPSLDECLHVFKQEHAAGRKAADWHAELNEADDEDDDEDDDEKDAAGASQSGGGSAAEVKQAEPEVSKQADQADPAADSLNAEGGRLEIAQAFEGLTWEVECTEHVLKWFKKRSKKGRSLCDQAIAQIRKIAEGTWGGRDQTHREQGISEVQLIGTKLTAGARILFEIAIAFSPRLSERGGAAGGRCVFSDVIRVWRIVEDHDNLGTQIRGTAREIAMKEIKESRRRGTTCRTTRRLLKMNEGGMGILTDDGTRVPKTYSPRDESAEQELEDMDDGSMAMSPPANHDPTQYNGEPTRSAHLAFLFPHRLTALPPFALSSSWQL